MGARIWGLGQSYPPFEHAFTSKPTPWVGVWIENTEQALQVSKQVPDAILMIPVRVSKDFKLFVMDGSKDHDFLKHLAEEQTKHPQTQILKGSRLSDYDLNTIESFFGTQLKLEDLLKAFPSNRFILHVLDNAEGVHVVLRDALKPLLINDKILINSDADVVISATKEQVPEWLYGTGHGALMRLMTFQSLHLEPAVQLKEDVAVAPLTILDRPAINQEVVNEVHRRNKKVILGPLINAEQMSAARQMNPDGFIFKNLDLALEFLKK